MASPPDMFDRLVELLRQNLQIACADLSRLAEQHRLEIRRLDLHQRRLEADVGKRALQVLQPSLGVALGATVDLAADIQSPTEELGEQTCPRPPRPAPEPDAPAGVEPKLLERWIDVPGVVKEDLRVHGNLVTSWNGVVPRAQAVQAARRPGAVLPRGSSNEFAVAKQTSGATRFQTQASLIDRRSHETGQSHAEEAAGGRRDLRRRVMHTVVNRRKPTIISESTEWVSHAATSTGGLARALSNVADVIRDRHGCLPDVMAMKEEVRRAVAKPVFSVASLYHDTGWPQAVARSGLFESGQLLLTFLNAVWIGVEIDGNASAFLWEADPVFQVVEHLFTVLFLAEWSVRFLAFKRKASCWRDGWFVTDTVLAVLMVLDTWVVMTVAMLSGSGSADLGDTSILRLMKITRLFRLARMSKLLSAFPELVVVIRGIGVAVRAVFFTLCLQLVIVYVFAVALRRLAEETPLAETRFSTVASTMRTLLFEAILYDYSEFIGELGQVNAILGIVSLLFVLLASITVMNFIVGVLVQVVQITSSVEREIGQVSLVRNRMHELLQEIGIAVNEDEHMSLEEFKAVLLHPTTASYMSEIGVDVVGLVDFTEVLFRGGESIQMSKFFELVMNLRGSNPTTVKDIVDLRYFLVLELRDLEEILGKQLEKAAESMLTLSQHDTC